MWEGERKMQFHSIFDIYMEKAKILSGKAMNNDNEILKRTKNMR